MFFQIARRLKERPVIGFLFDEVRTLWFNCCFYYDNACFTEDDKRMYLSEKRDFKASGKVQKSLFLLLLLNMQICGVPFAVFKSFSKLLISFITLRGAILILKHLLQTPEARTKAIFADCQLHIWAVEGKSLSISFRSLVPKGILSKKNVIKKVIFAFIPSCFRCKYSSNYSEIKRGKLHISRWLSTSSTYPKIGYFHVTWDFQQ